MDYLTTEDRARLENELKERFSNRRVLSNRIETARALGDLKENAEYHAAREDQGLNEARIRELEYKIKTAVVTGDQEVPEGMAFIGNTIKLRDVESGDEELYKLVGEASGNFDDDIIEVTASSPMGEALFKSRIGETVRVDLRRGTRRFEVLEIVS